MCAEDKMTLIDLRGRFVPVLVSQENGDCNVSKSVNATMGVYAIIFSETVLALLDIMESNAIWSVPTPPGEIIAPLCVPARMMDTVILSMEAVPVLLDGPAKIANTALARKTLTVPSANASAIAM
jgi:hypothetical protein